MNKSELISGLRSHYPKIARKKLAKARLNIIKKYRISPKDVKIAEESENNKEQALIDLYRSISQNENPITIDQIGKYFNNLLFTNEVLMYIVGILAVVSLIVLLSSIIKELNKIK